MHGVTPLILGHAGTIVISPAVEQLLHHRPQQLSQLTHLQQQRQLTSQQTLLQQLTQLPSQPLRYVFNVLLLFFVQCCHIQVSFTHIVMTFCFKYIKPTSDPTSNPTSIPTSQPTQVCGFLSRMRHSSSELCKVFYICVVFCIAQCMF